ncbi:MAG: LysR family transcriptional regulator [Pseudomonadota bacterium]
MAENPYHLPPLRALQAFEAAARRLSFKAAADELNVTPAAISHQVKALEKELRFKLFHRNHRGVELTETGAYLLVALQRGFEGISEAVDQLRSRSSQAAVTIISSTAISSMWLTPRLAEFWRTHGHISVGQIVSDETDTSISADLSILYGDISKDRGRCHILFKDRISALGSPSFAEKHALDNIADIGSLPLIHLDAAYSRWTTWEEWAFTLNYTGGLRTAHRVNNYVIALQAALDGIGAVLGWENLTRDYVKDGRLVKLLPDTIPSPLDFYVRLNNEASRPAQTLFEWLSKRAD